MKRLIFPMFVLLAAGCAHVEPETKYVYIEQASAARAEAGNGSLWRGGSAIADDLKARRPGDILTVLISENASASKEATTATKRASNISAGMPNMFGLEASKAFTNWMDLSKLINASTENKYDGSGSTTRKENLTATMSAQVMQVLPNGNLIIEGRRNVRVNFEDQIIVLTGMVRPRDITPDNVISSQLVADAKITYSGNGVITDKQRPGWLTTVFDWIWPF